MIWLTLISRTVVFSLPRGDAFAFWVQARNIVGSYESDVQKEEQGRNTEKTDHFDSWQKG